MTLEDAARGLAESLPSAGEPNDTSDRRALIVQRVNTAIVGMGIAIALLYGGIGVLYLQVQHLETATTALQSSADQNKAAVATLQADTLTNRENGYRTRAVNCQVLLSLGETLPPQCLEAPVVALYDPDAVPTAGVNSPGQIANRALLCGLYRDLRLPPPVEYC